MDVKLTDVDVSVLIPYRPDSKERAEALDFVVGWWHDRFPFSEVVIGTHPPEPEPWCKAQAYQNALRASKGWVLVLSDADTVFTDIGVAVAQVLNFGGWARGHASVTRLNREGTARLTALPRSSYYRIDQVASVNEHWDQWPYVQKTAGAGTVITRELYERVPHDPRFLGWGQEDDAWRYALERIHGPEQFTSPGKCIHLWHPEQPRQTRRGSIGNMALLGHYMRVFHGGDVDGMKQLVAEGSALLTA